MTLSVLVGRSGPRWFVSVRRECGRGYGIEFPRRGVSWRRALELAAERFEEAYSEPDTTEIAATVRGYAKHGRRVQGNSRIVLPA